MTMLMLRVVGIVLLTLAGGLAGWLLARQSWHEAELLRIYGEFLNFLHDGIGYRGIPADCLLEEARQKQAFAGLGLEKNCTCFSQIQVPRKFSLFLQQSLTSCFAGLAEIPRKEACARLKGAYENCRRALADKQQQALAQQKLYPRLGGCFGLVCALLLL